MNQQQGYVLGQTTSAARRLEIQDSHFADLSEQLLDDLHLRPNDRVVELGSGPGGFSRRILRRLGEGGVLVAVDSSAGLQNQARELLRGLGQARFEPVLADVSQLGSWLDGADVVVGRAVLHHIPMVEAVLGRLRTRLRPGTRVGFQEPDFRAPLGRLAVLEATGRPELAPLRIWISCLNQLYLTKRLSPDVGASLARTMSMAGYRNVRAAWSECRSDDKMIENMVMVYDEIREQLQTLHVLSADAVEEQQRLLRALVPEALPAAWGIYRVACEA